MSGAAGFRSNPLAVGGLVLVVLCVGLAVFADWLTPFPQDVGPIGDFAADDHFAGSTSDDVKIVRTGMHFCVIPDAVDLCEAEHGLLSMSAKRRAAGNDLRSMSDDLPPACPRAP